MKTSINRKYEPVYTLSIRPHLQAALTDFQARYRMAKIVSALGTRKTVCNRCAPCCSYPETNLTGWEQALRYIAHQVLTLARQIGALD